MSRVEIEGYTIGDEHRSEISSASFFSSIDRDGDGTLRRPELSTFIRDKIGGEPFDTHEEREREIESVLTRLDLNADNGLDEIDVMSYWKKNLDGLLGVEDVAEWLVHAVQLPLVDVESKFCHNHVTGYDFPELVENNGNRLRTELGVTNSRHVKKIMSLVNARMVGIESNLAKVQLDAPEVLCNRVKLTWGKVESNSGFPVHKYRLQRLAVPMERGLALDPSSSVEVEGSRGAAVRGRPCRDSTKPVDPWETVYDGMEGEYVDFNMKDGFEYTYRIEAWNALGRSPWVRVRPEKSWWIRSKCLRKDLNETAVPPNPADDSWSFHFILQLICGMKHLSCFFMMLVGYMMKLQRDNGDLARHPYFTSARNTLNSVGQFFLGRDIIPGKIDKKKMAIAGGIDGIAGCEQIIETQASSATSISSQSESVSPVDETVSNTSATKKLLSMIKRKKKKSFTPKSERTISAFILPDTEVDTTQEFCNEERRISDLTDSGKHACVIVTTSDPSDPSDRNVNDDPKKCAICNKKFNWRRRCHHCSKCFKSFCGKHGKCKHPAGTPCPVRGSCVCNICLKGEGII